MATLQSRHIIYHLLERQQKVYKQIVVRRQLVESAVSKVQLTRQVCQLYYNIPWKVFKTKKKSAGYMVQCLRGYGDC